LYVIIIYMSLFSEKINFNFSKKCKILIISIIILVIGLISTALFIQAGMEKGNSIIKGIQARYFIPILFLVPFIFNIKKEKFSQNLIFILFCILYLPAIFTIIITFI